MNLTKSNVEKLPTPHQCYVLHWDDTLPGFGVRVTSTGVKAYMVQQRIGSRTRRITLGRHGVLSAETARKEAAKLLGMFACGRDPVAEKKAKQLQGVTLEQVFNDYIGSRKDLKPKTLYDYRRVMDVAFDDWRRRPLLNITKDTVERRHRQLGDSRGEAYANLSMRLLRALFNFAMGKYEDVQGRSLITDNPVKRLSQTRAWYRVDRRKTVIKTHELAAWHQGVMELPNTTLRDYLLLVLFTGLRRQEAAGLRWCDVDLKSKTLTVLNTKNREDHVLPLSDYLYDLLNVRQKQHTGEFVFPGAGAGGYIVEPRKQMAKVTQVTGVAFTVHDLRRTFITIAESLDIPAYALKRLANHKMSGDVTAGYIVADVERLRKPMQAITDYLLRCAGVAESAPVIPFTREEAV
jgi:integrase